MKKRQSKTLGLAALALAVVALAAGSAAGQGFMVKPMRIEVSARPGQTVQANMELRNTTADAARTLDVALHEIAQNDSGGWMIVGPDSGVDLSRLSSCLEWTSLDARSVEIPPLERRNVRVTLEVPHRARGYYFAAITAQSRPPEAARGISLVVRFLVPVIVEIQGRPERQRIELDGLGMDYREATDGRPAETSVVFGVANEGRTFSRVRGNVRVMYDMDGRWRPVSTADIPEKGIIPGSRLRLKSDLGRRLPSGRYRLTGALYVDGRRARGLEKEIAFEGDPEATRLAVDSALLLEPREVAIAGAPGATRTTILQVENPSEDALEVSAFSAVPPPLRGVAMGELKGVELSCADWLQVMPGEFVLRPGGRQNVRLVARMPRNEEMHANYYGLVGLRAAYADGQSAGETMTVVTVSNRAVEPAPKAQAVRLALAAVDGAKHAVRARFSNVGNVDFRPRAEAALLNARGQRVASMTLSGEEGRMLPLEVRDFSGEMDFAGVEPGTYALRAALDWTAGEGAAKQVVLRVAEEDGERTVTVLDLEELPDPEEAGGEEEQGG